MLIAHVIGNLGDGGAEALLHRVVTWPSQEKHHIISLGHPSKYSGLLQKRGVTVTHLRISNFWQGACVLPKLTQLLVKLRPDVVHCWMYHSNIIGGLSGKLAGVPVVWSIHCGSFDELPFRSQLWVYLNGIAARWLPARIINCSVQSCDRHSRIGFEHAPVEVVPNGYDPAVFRPDEVCRAALRSELGIAPTTFLIGTVARWHPQKDIPNLINALGIIREMKIDWVCVLAGSGLNEANGEFMKLVRAAGIEDKLIAHGQRDDIENFMRAIDLHVLPSAEEAFPNVVAEAMSSGTPCVVTDVGDARLMVGESGWIVPPRSSDDLATAITEAQLEWQNKEFWEGRRSKARQRIEKHFSLRQMIQSYRRIWTSVTNLA